ncbi:hypothetical protein FF38_05827 [Lucilia cuprina]|uniref:Uncharacterized protein n=2 Tax=Lucilia cuprina TaxID=7375 RepID=A0A0L0CPX1_LUCCU|nr:hypothetical protein CVS40_4655 [Lucilia cuprina]KNC33484.1 hypothetical protein FF38_05827 [Lucilia cuprina]
MDILKKMFQQNEDEAKKNLESNVSAKDEFRKPQWFEEAETDDELFDDDRKFVFQIFTNPMELQKHFERQMQQILEAVSEMEGDNGIAVEKDLKEEYLKPGFESEILKEFEKQKKQYFDTDLDGEIFPEQLHSLIQRFANGEGEVIKHIPESEAQGNILPRNDNKFSRNWKTKPKLSDEEIIMGKIHGTLIDEDKELRKRPAPPSMIPRGGRPDIMTPMTPMMPRGSFGGGAFDGNYQGPKMFSQSVMTKTIRKPDGTYETTKVTQDSQGNKTTTVTRTVDGKTETITTYDGAAGGGTAGHNQMLQRHADNKPEAQVYSDRNVYVSKEGYALPRNLW